MAPAAKAARKSKKGSTSSTPKTAKGGKPAVKDLLKGQLSVSSFFKTPSPASQVDGVPAGKKPEPKMTGKKVAVKTKPTTVREVVVVDADDEPGTAAEAPVKQQAPQTHAQAADDVMAVDEPADSTSTSASSVQLPASQSKTGDAGTRAAVSNTRLEVEQQQQRTHGRGRLDRVRFDLSSETPRKPGASAAAATDSNAEEDSVIMSERDEECDDSAEPDAAEDVCDGDAQDSTEHDEASHDSATQESAPSASSAAATLATPTASAAPAAPAAMDVVEISDDASETVTPTLSAASAAVSAPLAGKGKGRGKARASTAGAGRGGGKGKGKASAAKAAAATATVDADGAATGEAAAAAPPTPPPPHPLLGRYTEQLQCLLSDAAGTAEEDEADHHAGLQEALTALKDSCTTPAAAAAATGAVSDDADTAASTDAAAATQEESAQSAPAAVAAAADTMLAAAAAFPEELASLLARLVQGSRAPLPALAASVTEALLSLVPPVQPALDLTVLTPELVGEKIVAIAGRKAWGAAPKKAILKTDESAAALWRWEVEMTELLHGGETSVKAVRAERGSTGRHIKALVKLIEALGKHPADPVKISVEEEKVAKFTRQIEAEKQKRLLKARAKASKDEEKASKAAVREAEKAAKEAVKEAEKAVKEAEKAAKEERARKEAAKSSVLKFFTKPSVSAGPVSPAARAKAAVSSSSSSSKGSGSESAAASADCAASAADLAAESSCAAGAPLQQQGWTDEKAAAFQAALHRGLTHEELLAEAAAAGRRTATAAAAADSLAGSKRSHRTSGDAAAGVAAAGAFHAPPAKRARFTVQVSPSAFAAPDAAAMEKQVEVGGRMKLLKFTEDVRPPYWGTFSKRSSRVSGRRHLGKAEQVDYDYDSEASWDEGCMGGGEEIVSEAESEEPDALDYTDRWLRYDDEFSDDEIVSGDEGEGKSGKARMRGSSSSGSGSSSKALAPPRPVIIGVCYYDRPGWTPAAPPAPVPTLSSAMPAPPVPTLSAALGAADAAGTSIATAPQVQHIKPSYHPQANLSEAQCRSLFEQFRAESASPFPLQVYSAVQGPKQLLSQSATKAGAAAAAAAAAATAAAIGSIGLSSAVSAAAGGGAGGSGAAAGGSAEGGASSSGKKVQGKSVVPEELMPALLQHIHKSFLTKPQLVSEFVAKHTGCSKVAATRILTEVASKERGFNSAGKKVMMWVVRHEVLVTAGLAAPAPAPAAAAAATTAADAMQVVPAVATAKASHAPTVAKSAATSALKRPAVPSAHTPQTPLPGQKSLLAYVTKTSSPQKGAAAAEVKQASGSSSSGSSRKFYGPYSDGGYEEHKESGTPCKKTAVDTATAAAAAAAPAAGTVDDMVVVIE